MIFTPLISILRIFHAFQKAAHVLAGDARKRWEDDDESVDDITVVVAFLNKDAFKAEGAHKVQSAYKGDANVNIESVDDVDGE